MRDPRIEAVAKVLVEYSVDVRPGQLVRLRGNPEGSPLLLAVYRQTLERGGHPWLTLDLEETQELFLRHAAAAQLDYVAPFLHRAMEEIDASISVWAESNTKALSQADPGKQSRRAVALKPLFDRFLSRAASGDLRWVETIYPTQAFAQDAEMSLAEFEDFVYRACRADEADPIAAWREVSARQQGLVDFLQRRSAIRVVAEGTDLTLSVAGRRWENCDGRMNFPDGEVFTGPVESSANGEIRFSYPACLYGREVEDVRLSFRDGSVVKATAAKNEAFLHEMLALDEGAKRLGEFALGTNPGITRFTKNVLFDEKIGGTIHLALGKGYPETGSENQSAIHWDMVCDLRRGGRLYSDGELLLEDGRLLVS